MSGREGRLPSSSSSSSSSSSRPHHGGSHHTSSREDSGRSRDKDRREVEPERRGARGGDQKPQKSSVGPGPSGSRLWPPEEEEEAEEEEEDGEVPSSYKVGLPPLSEGRRSSGNNTIGNPNPNRNPSPNPYRNPSPNHNPNPNRNPSPNPYRNPSPNHNPNPNPSPSTNLNHNPNPNRNPSPNHNCNPNSNPSPSTSTNPNPNQNRNLSPNPNQNPSPNPSSSPSPRINSNPNQNPSPSNNPNLYPNPSPNPDRNPNPSPSPGTGPSRQSISRRSSVEKEPGELSSGSGSEDSGGEMDRPSCSPKRPLPDSSSSGASPYRKRKYSPIVWDLDEKNHKSASSPLPLPPPPLPPPLLPSHLQTTPNPPPPPAVSRSTITSYSPSPHMGSDRKLESGQVLSSPHSMDEEEEKEEEESMPHINIAASRWADEEEEDDLSPREEKASKRVKGWSRNIDNGGNGRNGVNPLFDNGMVREDLGDYPREKTESIGGGGLSNRDDDARDLSNEELYERERIEKEFGDEEDMASEDEAGQRTENPEEEEARPAIPPAPPQRAIDMLQGCRSVDEFERLNKINEGTYGVVYRARNKKTGEIVALKKVKMEREREGFPLTSLREINVLLSFHHPSIVDVKEVVVGSNLDSIFMVMEYMEHDLKGLMETMKQPFSQSEVKCLMLQLLEGVKYLHDNWVLHRDLKTSNLLLNNCGELKICDFGLARQYGSPLKSYTHMVVTLWYRAPELLLGAKQYSTALDMWSVGCIMAELLSKEPLINGKNELDQLDKIFKTLGTPSEKIWPDLPKLSVKCNFTRQPYNRLKEKFPPTSFSGRPTLSLAGLDLLNRFLTYDPKKRITAEEALQHEWFKEVPLPSMKELMPTFPARSEHERRVRRLMKSPDPLEEQRKRELLQAQLGPVGLFG